MKKNSQKDTSAVKKIIDLSSVTLLLIIFISDTWMRITLLFNQ